MNTVRAGETITFGRARPMMPSAGRMAVNAIRAAVKTTVHAASGKGISAAPELIEKRRAICQSNVCGFYVAETERCAHKKCGCFLRFKRYLKSQTCPDHRW